MSDQTSTLNETNRLLMEIHRSVGSLDAGFKGLHAELSDVKSDVGEVKDQNVDLKLGQARLEERLLALPCSFHADQFNALRGELKSVQGEVRLVDLKVDDILTKDLPDIYTKLVVLDWWKSHRNKTLAIALMAVVGVLTALVGDYLKSWILPHNAKTSVQAQEIPASPVALDKTQP